MNTKKIIIVNNGSLPIPAVKGGAVETLINLLIDENEQKKAFLFEVYSTYDVKAIKASKKYTYTVFHFVKTNSYINKLRTFFTKCVNFITLRTKGYYHVFPLYKKIISNVKKDRNSYAAIILEGAPYNAYELRKETGLPIIQRIHNIPSRTATLFNEQSAKATHMYIGISEFICNNLKQIEGKYCNNIELLYNSINFSLFQRKINREEEQNLMHKLGFEKNDFIVMFSGRIQEYKGIKQLLKAMILLQNIPNIKLLVVGSSFFSTSHQTPFEKSLLPLIKQLNKKVIFTGYVDYEEMYKYYNIANLCVFPSTWEEPFALTCLEALACSKPVLITKSGGMTEVVNDKCSIIIPNDSNLVNNLAYAIKNIIADKNRLNIMAKESLKRAEKFSSDNQFEQFSLLMKKYL